MAKPKDKTSLIQDITNRYRVTAREARDIVTAVGTHMVTTGPVQYRSDKIKNKGSVYKQIGETVKAAATGEKGTTPNINKRLKSGEPILTMGKKR